ncbi:TPA: TIGR03087 family PEP-CTERM/XrtA system glycosyltransferase, partial [Candidatus Poribacteria bacterium]|nr:TIGR03087 family PEP-CTERM/XrtA system glycosyltransferase [Candidatus Poribacteria bacterium]HEX28921.1 TIGR03087 family PEP-CTERM/XrtA system glycosyltransferase [Candidatus Poribacteria bacterium]
PYPPNRGDKIRSYHIIRYLSQKHRISVACLIQSPKELPYVESLKQYCYSVKAVLLKPLRSKVKSLIGLLGSDPLTLRHYLSKQLRKIAADEVSKGNLDLIYVYSSSMAQYVTEYRDVKKILDIVDVDSDKWYQYSKYANFPLSLIYKLEGNRMRRYEMEIVGRFDKCIVISEVERDLLRSYAPHADIAVIPNGVNHEFLKPGEGKREPHTLIFTGVMDYYANVDGVLYFHRQILPQIRGEIPDVKFYVVGSNPVKEIRRLAERDKNVIVTGFVEDVRPYQSKAAVCVVPLRIARGIQNKILEAMSMELPVVTTSRAFEGINAEPGRHLFVEDDPSKFAQRVIELLKDRELREQIARNARQLILERYDWDNCLAKLDQIIT